MDSGHQAVTLRQFLNTLFSDRPTGFVDLVTAEPGSEGKVWFVDHNAAAFGASAGPYPVYVCISTCDPSVPRSRKPSRKHPVLTYFVVLDDVGTKIKLDKLPAGIKVTYALETSPGNFQIGFRFSSPVEPHRGAALIDALATGGFTDAGSKSDVRLVRVPGSLNGKPQHGEWRARLTTWNPDVSYTYSELATAFGVVPSDTPARASAPELEEGQQDHVAEYLVQHQGEVGCASGLPIRGLIPLLCPQHDQHTVGVDRANDSSTVWIPGAPGAFKCTHGHCINFRTPQYLSWMRQHHPAMPAGGLTVDLKALGSALRKALEGSPGKGGLFTPPPEDGVREAILGDLVKVGSRDRYFTLSGQEYLTRAGVDDAWFERMNAVGLLDSVTATGRPTTIAPHVWLRRQPDTRRVAKVVHRLGRPLITDGDLNIAPSIPERPNLTGTEEPGPWLDLMEHVCGGNGALTDLLIDWMAMMVGSWDEKPGWHVMLRGPSGTGKNLIFQPLMDWMGPHYQEVNAVHIGAQFHPFLTKRLCIADEVKMNTKGATSMHDIYTTLKAWTTRGNDLLTVRVLYGEYTALNRSGWVVTSNMSIPLPLDQDDRRFLVIEPPIARPDQYYQELVRWGEAGGYDQVIAWLGRQWDLMPEEDRAVLRGTAPMTLAKKRLIEGAAEGITGAVRLATSGAFGVQWPELTTLRDAVEDLKIGNASSYLPDVYRRQLSDQRVATAMREAGWVQLFDGDQAQSGATRLRLWCRTARRAVLYYQLGRGKKLIDRYLELKKNKLTGIEEDPARADFNPLRGTSNESEE